MNKCFLTGRLTKEPELQYTNNNTAYTKFSIAVDRRFKKEGGQEVDFINITAWSKTAEFIQKYFSKGSKINIFGRIQVDNYEDKDGNKRNYVSVVVEEYEFGESKKVNSNSHDENSKKKDEGFEPLDDDALPF